VSRLTRYPASNDTEKAGFLYEDSLSYLNPQDLLEGNKSLAGTYYVMINGYTAATYDISYRVKMKKGAKQFNSSERRLYPGYVDFGNLDFGYLEKYYFQYDESDELFPPIDKPDPLEPPQKLKLFIYFNQFNKTSNQKSANLFFWPTVTMTYRNPDTGNETAVEFADVFYSLDFFQFTILVHRGDMGKYQIVLNHSMDSYKEIRLKYYISINHNNINNIVP